ncbi:TonB family protein [Curvivirga sp.]|uniref:energy transducer TonB n=1 Tax=Curvivirga sp. TaxID=2856848 RepID=UPI003B5BD35A
MVTVTNMQVSEGVKWSFYLAFSACLLFGVMNQFSMQRPEPKPSLLEPLKIKLVTLAAPKAVELQSTSVAANMPQPTLKQVVPEKVVVTTNAVEKIVQKSKQLPLSEVEISKKTAKLDTKVLPIPPAPIKPMEPVENVSEQKSEEIPQIVKKVEEIKQLVPELTVAEDVEKPAEPIPDTSIAKEAIGTSSATVIQDAKYRKQTAPVYPRRARDLGQQGIVMIHAHVMPDGRPVEIKVAESSGHRLLDLSALSAVKKWEFEPVHHNGEPSEGWVRVPVRFVIQ